jgi:hypothetical protein
MIRLAVHVFLFLLVIFLLCLALLWRLGWPHLQPSNSSAGRKRIPLHRLLKPRTPLDCPACRLASTQSSGVKAACAPVRPWCEVKSRRGAPKWIPTEGFACPNPQCLYFDNPYHVHFQAQHSFISSKPPFAAGRRGSLSAGRRTGSFGYRQATITAWLTRAGNHAQTVHERMPSRKLCNDEW